MFLKLLILIAIVWFVRRVLYSGGARPQPRATSDHQPLAVETSQCPRCGAYTPIGMKCTCEQR